MRFRGAGGRALGGGGAIGRSGDRAVGRSTFGEAAILSAAAREVAVLGQNLAFFVPRMPPRGINSPKLPPLDRAGFVSTPHTPNSGSQPQTSGPLAPSSVAVSRFGGGCLRVLPKAHRLSECVQWRFPDSVGVSRQNQRESTPPERPFGGGGLPELVAIPVVGWRLERHVTAENTSESGKRLALHEPLRAARRRRPHVAASLGPAAVGPIE
jgi:hypothetical protein